MKTSMCVRHMCVCVCVCKEDTLGFNFLLMVLEVLSKEKL